MGKKVNKKWRLDKDGNPYAICPNCNKRMYTVLEDKVEDNLYELLPNKHSNTFGDKTYYDTDINIEYLCPNCREELPVKSQESAEDLFKEPAS